jgi:hypothetical protein
MPTIYDIERMKSNSKEIFSDILNYVNDAVGKTELHDFEKNLFEQLQKLGLALLENFIADTGTGYNSEQPPVDETNRPLRYKGTKKSPYFSMFGEVLIERARYQTGSGSYYYPLDAQLNLPAQKYSYLLQKWLQAGAVQTNYQKAVELINEIFDHQLYPYMPQRIGKTVASHVDEFNDQAPAPDTDTEGTHLAISADGKGIRMLPSERTNNANDQQNNPRLGRGEKRGTKKQSTVTVDFSFDPAARTPEEIVAALLKEQTSPQQPDSSDDDMNNDRTARNKHVRATLAGKENAMNYLMERLKKRDPTNSKPIIALVDGDNSQTNALKQAIKTYKLNDRLDAIILDIIHVAEYVWSVGTALNGEYNDKRIPWVREKLLSILQGNVGRVIGGFKQMLTKQSTTSAQRRVLEKSITYFENHREMMNYHDYLKQGYPIATGLVEGTCNCLVKDRMEQSGMRWSKNGATAILKQRAVRINGDWETFWKSFMKQQSAILYPDTYKSVA